MPESTEASRTASKSTESLSPSGMGFAVACYLGWGLVPIYWKGVSDISSIEALIPRILWTLFLLLAAASLLGRSHETWAEKGKAWAWNALAAGLLATNWGLFIYAVNSDQLIATSLGYYINPLVSILFGLALLGERLNRIQTGAVAIAAAGVATLTIREGELPWISLVLAITFGLYGLIHKIRPQPPLAGLTREMLILAPATLAGAVYFATQPDSGLARAGLGDHAYLAFAGVVTAGPLLLFHAATKRLPLVAVGMFQYIAPTISLLLATFIYGEAFTTSHVLGFGFVWIGLIAFSLDSLRRARAQRNEIPLDFATTE